MSGPATMKESVPLFSSSSPEPGNRHFILQSFNGKPIPNAKYRIQTTNGVVEGISDASGKTSVVEGKLGDEARIELL